jgi:hypothetical protein
MVLHRGEDLTCGHYRALVRKGELWFLVDDLDSASPATLVDFADFVQKDDVRREVYMLFYELRAPTPDPPSVVYPPTPFPSLPGEPPRPR